MKIATKIRFAVAMFALCISLIPAATAQAATCYGTNCNNRNAYTTGCAGSGASWRVIDMRYINHYATGARLGYVQLWWSDTCQTNWSRVVSTSGPKYLKAYIFNNGGERSAIFSNAPQTEAIGTMQNGRGIPWAACGVISSIPGGHASGACTAQW